MIEDRRMRLARGLRFGTDNGLQNLGAKRGMGCCLGVLMWLSLSMPYSLLGVEENIFLNVPEIMDEGYELIYSLDLPLNAEFRGSTHVPYSVDNSGSAPDFDRIAYYLELTNEDATKWVYVSMDAFTSDPIAIGIPHSVNNPVKHQRPVANMNVFSNVGGVTTGTFIDTGNIEMWPSNYTTTDTYGVFAASSSIFDWGNGGADNSPGYGVFQIHNAVARQTILAYNAWGVSAGGNRENDDIGIGSRPQGHPDWTFAGNTGDYSERKLMVLVRPRRHDISFCELPRDRQLYSRDLSTNRAKVRISGEESFGGYDEVVLRVSRNGEVHEEVGKPLGYEEGAAPFSFEVEIDAELAKYDFDVLLRKDDDLTVVERVKDVVAGDAFFFYGQSNAEAMNYNPQQSANDYSSEWLLTFGQNGDDGVRAQNILHWVEAEGDGGRDGPGSIGQWAMVLGRALIDEHEVPIAILNGSRGGYKMSAFRKDREDPDNLHDGGGVRRPYNRLLFRAKEAGVAETARAMFFYQGESDRTEWLKHYNGHVILRQDWAGDYPGLEHFYVTQVRPGCGLMRVEDMEVRNVQRRLGDLFPNTTVMASNGLESHDGCHFWFEGGYEDLGWNHFRIVSRDLYGGPDGPDIEALHPSFVVFTDETRTELRLSLRNQGATVNFPEGAISDFVIEDSSVSIVRRSVSGTDLYLELSEPAAEGSVLQYRGHLGPGEWITNANGIGLLSFIKEVSPAISAGPGGSQLFGEELSRLADGSEEAVVHIQLRDQSGNPLRLGGIEITFSTTLGTFADGESTYVVRTDNDGRAIAILTSENPGTADVSAEIDGVGPVAEEESLSVNFETGPPAGYQVELDADDAEHVYVGKPFSLKVTLTDDFGRPVVADEELDFAITLKEGSGFLSGSTGGVFQDGTGEVVVSGLRYSAAEGDVVFRAETPSGNGPILPGKTEGIDVFPVGVHVGIDSGPGSVLEGTVLSVTVSVSGALDTPREREALSGIPMKLGTDSLTGGKFGNGMSEVEGVTGPGGKFFESYSVGTGSGIEEMRAEVLLNGEYFDLLAVDVISVLSTINITESGSLLSGTQLECVADGIDEATLSVQLRDESGNDLKHPGIAVLFETDLGTFSGGASESLWVETDEDGLATVALSSTVAGEASVTAKVDGLGDVGQGSPLKVSFSPGAAAKLELTIETIEDFYVGAPFGAIVTLVDEFGNITTRDTETEISIALDGDEHLGELVGVVSGTVPAGSPSAIFETVRFNVVEEDVRIIARDSRGALGKGVSPPMKFYPMELNLALDSNSVVAGDETVISLVATARGVGGSLDAAELEGIPIVFTSGAASGGSFAGESLVETDSEGVAIAAFLPGTVATDVSLKAAFELNTAFFDDGQLKIRPGEPHEMRLSGSAESLVAGRSRDYLVEVRDVHGNLVGEGWNGVLVDVNATGVGTVDVASPTALENGRGYFSVEGVKAGEIDLQSTILESDDGLISNVIPFSVVGGAADRLVISTQPVGDTSGGALAMQPVVEVWDFYGNPAKGNESMEVVVNIISGDGGVLNGTTIRNAGGGVVEFDDLELSGVAGEPYVFAFADTAGNLGPVESEVVTVTSGEATRLVFLDQPGNSLEGWPIVPAVVIAFEDAMGNSVTANNDSVTVTIEANPGEALLSGATRVSALEGVATFTNLLLDAPGEGYTLRAEAAGLTGAVSSHFDVSPAMPVLNETKGDYYQSIQAAIDEATEGDVIRIANGIYSENLILDRSLIWKGDFTLFPDLGSIIVESDTFFAGAVRIQTANMQFADHVYLQVAPEGELVIDGSMVDSPGRINLWVEDGGELYLARNFLQRVDITLDSPNAEIYNNVLTASTLTVNSTADGATVFHNLVDDADWLHAAEETAIITAVDGWDNVTELAGLKNRLVLDLKLDPAPLGSQGERSHPDLEAAGRTVDEGGNIYIQPGDVFDVALDTDKLTHPVEAVRVMLGHSAERLLMETITAFPPWTLFETGGGTDDYFGWIDAVFNVSSEEHLATPGSVTMRAGSEEGHTQVFFRTKRIHENTPGSAYGTNFRIRDTISSYLTPFTTNPGVVTIDGTSPEVKYDLHEAVTQGGRDIMKDGKLVEQGTVSVVFDAFDALAGIAEEGVSVLLSPMQGGGEVHGILEDVAPSPDTPQFIRYTFFLPIEASQPNGYYILEARVVDRAGNETQVILGEVKVHKDQIELEIELDGIGDGEEGSTREIDFVFSDEGGSVLERRTEAVSFRATGSVVLPLIPEGVTHVSAKGPKHLRRKVSVSLDEDGQGVAFFNGANRLLGGDLIGDNVVGPRDLGVLKRFWDQAVATEPKAVWADITGDGYVGADDVEIFLANWRKVGDPE